jgi:hypothetical protein
MPNAKPDVSLSKKYDNLSDSDSDFYPMPELEPNPDLNNVPELKLNLTLDPIHDLDTMPSLETPKKSVTESIFCIIRNDGKADRMLMATSRNCGNYRDYEEYTNDSLRSKYFTYIYTQDNEVPEVLRI